MRAKEILREEYTPQDAEAFFRNCSDFFSYNKNPIGNNLWRGDNGKTRSDNFWKNERNVSQGRKPVDTDEFVHTLFNDWFSTKFNFPFRSGMMCSGSQSSALDYGRTYIIVPCNGYTLCYSPKIEDLYKAIPGEIYDQLEYMQFDIYDGTSDQTKAEKVIRKNVVKLLNDGGYVAGLQHTHNAIMSDHEVMLYPTDYSTLEYYSFTQGFWDDTVVPMIEERLHAGK